MQLSKGVVGFTGVFRGANRVQTGFLLGVAYVGNTAALQLPCVVHESRYGRSLVVDSGNFPEAPRDREDLKP